MGLRTWAYALVVISFLVDAHGAIVPSPFDVKQEIVEYKRIDPETMKHNPIVIMTIAILNSDPQKST